MLHSVFVCVTQAACVGHSKVEQQPSQWLKELQGAGYSRACSICYSRACSTLQRVCDIVALSNTLASVQSYCHTCIHPAVEQVIGEQTAETRPTPGDTQDCTYLTLGEVSC